MLKIFIKKSYKFLAVLLTATLALSPLSYANITGGQDGTQYTYQASETTDIIETSKMINGTYLDTSSNPVLLPNDTTVTELGMNLAPSVPTGTANWTNDTALTITNARVILSRIDATNNSTINANKIIISQISNLNSNASNITTTNGIINNGTISFTGGTNANAITGTGTVIVDGDVTSNTSIANAMTINATKSLTIGTDNVDGAVNNLGTLNLGEGTLEQAVSGTGNIVTAGNVATVAGNLGNAVANDYQLTLNGGTLAKAITGTGTTVIADDVTSNASIANAITINSSKNLQISADNVGGTVSNEAGSLYLVDGTLGNAITGAGTTSIGGTVTANASIANATTVMFSSKLTSNADYIDGIVTNHGVVELTEGQLDKAISGGSVTIDGNVTSKALIASEMTINSEKSLTIDANNVGGTVGNEGILKLQSDGVTPSTLVKVVAGRGTTEIDGDIISDVYIGQGITINESKKLKIGAANVGGTVSNVAGTLELTDGTLSKAVTGAGTTIIAGDVISSTSIANAMTINATKSLTIGADNVDGAVNNLGTLNLGEGTLEQAVSGTGNIVTAGNVATVAGNLGNAVANDYQLTLNGGTLAKAITGTGTTVIADDVTSNASISNAITINATKNLTIGADNVGGAVSNAGTLTLGTGTLGNAVTGTGTTVINGSVISDAKIANAITINEAKKLLTNANNVGGTVSNVAGTLELTEGTLNYAVTGGNNGITTITGNVISNASIANAMTILYEKSLTISADNVDGAVKNYGTLNLGEGTLEQNVSGTTGNIITTADVSTKNTTIENKIANEYTLTLKDSTNIKGNISGTNGKVIVEATANDKEITNSANINQYSIEVKKGIFNNTGTITSAKASLKIDENGTLNSDASKIISYDGKIDNDGNLVFTAGENANNVYGTGKLTIIGSSQNSKEIVQKELTANEKFTNNGTITVEKINGTSELENNNKLNLNLKEADAYTLKSLTGTGSTTITANTENITIDNSDKIIQQKTITTYGDKTLLLTGTGEIKADVVNYMTGDCLDIETTIDGTLSNYAITNIKTNGVVTGQIENTGKTSQKAKLNILANTYDVQAGITGDTTSISYNLLNIGDATNSVGSAVTSQTKIENQTITVSSGTVTLSGAGKISNSNLTIEDNGYVFANAGKLDIINNEIINDGTLTLVGTNVINENKIVNSTDDISKGKVEFGDGTSTNSIINKADIKQQEIDVKENTKVTNNNILISDILDVKGELVNNNTDTSSIIVSGINGITVDTTGKFTTNASAIDSAYGIYNDGALTFTGGINETLIAMTTGTGTLNIKGDLINNNTIAQQTINVGQDVNVTNNYMITTDKITIGTGSSFITDINNILKTGLEGGEIENAGKLVITNGTNKNTITGTGTTQITNGALVTNDKGVSVSQKNIIIDNESTLQTSAKDLNTTTSITNNGILRFNQEEGVDENNNKIIGEGSLFVETGTLLTNNNVISQKNIEVSANSSLTTDVNKIITSNGIKNDGIMTLTGSGVNSNIIAGAGALNFGDGTETEAVTIINNAVIAQETININSMENVINTGVLKTNNNITNAGTLLTDASSLITIAGITNTGNLIFNGGTNINEITGTGTVTIAGDVISTNSISNVMTINSEKSLTISADNVGNAIVNAGTLNLGAGELTKEVSGTGNIVTKGDITTSAAKLLNTVTNDYQLTLNGGKVSREISGLGRIVIDGPVESDVSIANAIKINSEKSLTIGADNVDGAVNNLGTLNLGTGTLEQIVSGTGNIVTVGNVTTDANNLQNTVTNNSANILTLIAGTITKSISGTGSTTIAGNVTNNSTVAQNTVVVNDGSSLTTDIDNITTTVCIENAGTLIFNADGTNSNVITSVGKLITTSNITNDANITQNELDVESGIFTNNTGKTITTQNINIASGAVLKGKAADLIATGSINNDGVLGFNVGGDDTLSSILKGDGVMAISANASGTETNLTLNNATINQKAIAIDNKSSLIADASSVMTTYAIDNAGILNFTAGTNKNYIIGIGTTTISGNVINAINAVINQTDINIKVGNSLVVNSINNVTATNEIINDGTLIVATTDGINNNKIEQTGIGTLNINTNLLNDASINQRIINVAEGKIFQTSAANLAETSTEAKIDLKGSNTNLVLEDNTATTLEEQIIGKGSLVKIGSGILTLTNTNDYKGTTAISDGSIKIGSANNIGKNTIYMNGGSLITTADMTLSNTITATENNNTNIEVESGTTELTKTITEATTKSDLVKYGAGTLNLTMASNGYTGDTIIKEGRVIGNTKNINNVVKGEGVGEVEFVDNNETVVLNKIDNLSVFEKTGSAIMKVEKDFKALIANIKNGELIINNDKEQAEYNEEIVCSDAKFEVGTMTLTDSVLRGYADIKGNLVVGSNAELTPGNSIGIIKLDGNLALNTGSTYTVEFDQFETEVANAESESYSDEDANDKTTVSGTGIIETGAKLMLENDGGKYYVKETFKIIETKGGLTGNYASSDITFVDADANDLRPSYETRINYSLENDGKNLILTAQRKKSDYENATEFTRSHNQQEVATIIDNVSTGFGGDIVNVLDKLEKYYYYKSTYDTVALKEALDDMSGVIYANTSWLTLINSKAEHVFDKIGDRTRTPDLFPCSKLHDRVWGEYYYNNFHTDANADSKKFDTETNGFLVGFDVLTLDSWTIGVTAGYGESDLKQAKSDKSKMKDINLGFYGGYEGQKWVFKGMLLGGYEMYDTERNIGFMNRQATSGHDGYSATAELEAGYKIALNPNSKKEHKLFLKPFVGLNGNYTEQNGFNEKGADSLNLSVDQHEAFTAQAKAGVGINGKTKAFEWYVDGYARKFLTDRYMEATMSLIDLPGTTEMRIKSADMSSMTIGARIGGDYNFDENWKIFANILASRSDTTRNYYGNIGVSYKFDCLTNKKENNDSEKDKEIAKLKKEIKDLQKEVENANKKLNVVSEQEAKKMKTKVVKQFKLDSKPTFVFDSSELTRKGIGSLAEVAQEISKYKDCEVLIEGHTDGVGDDKYNQKLSEQRAKAIAKALKDNYDVKNKISIIGKGKKEPITSNGTQEGREKNRRVEITIVTTQK